MSLSDIIEDVFNLEEDKQQDEIQFMKLNEWDSMTHMLFITKIEEELDIEFSGDEIAGIESIGDVRKLVDAKK